MTDTTPDTERRFGRRWTRLGRQPGLWHLMVRRHTGGETVCGAFIYAANPRDEEYRDSVDLPDGKACPKCKREATR